MIDDLCGWSIGDYVLQERAGEGSFSRVYLAVHRQTEEPGAFKIARKEVDETAGNTDQAWTRALVDQTRS
jgi:serine/threonine protein kinase